MTGTQARRPETHAALFTLCEAREVASWEGEILSLRGAGAPVPARLAASCLLRPQEGDLVLTAEAEGETWVLAVLRAGAPRKMRLDVTGDLSLAASGTLNLEGAQVTLRASEFNVEARSGLMLIGELRQVGQKITTQMRQIGQFAERLESVVGAAILRAGRNLRLIEGEDVLRAQSIDQRARGDFSVQAQTAFVTAKAVVKLDADQIMLG
jgi:hypothetical protein